MSVFRFSKSTRCIIEHSTKKHSHSCHQLLRLVKYGLFSMEMSSFSHNTKANPFLVGEIVVCRFKVVYNSTGLDCMYVILPK